MPTQRLVKFSFGFLKVAALGLIAVYLIAVITVGAAGHNSADTVSFLAIFTYAILLILLLIKFQKQASRIIRTLLLIMLIPPVVVVSYFVVMIIYEVLSRKSGLIEVKLLIAFLFSSFAAASGAVIRALITGDSGSKV